MFGVSEGAQDISFQGMADRQLALADIIGKDPDVDAYVASVGATGGLQTENAGRFFISLKPRDQRTSSADEVIRRLRQKTASLRGISLFLQVAQDINVGGRLSKTQYQYTLQDANLDELNEWAPRLMETLQSLPEVQDVATDQLTSAATVTMTIDRDTAARFGIQPGVIDDTLYDAFGQRQIAQYFTQLSQYHVILEVTPRLQADPRALDKIYLKSPTTGQQVPLATFVKLDTAKTNYLSINHQGQFPAVTLSFNLSPGTALGQAIDAISKAEAKIGKPGSISATFQGTAQAFQSSLATQPYLIAAAIVVVYIILGMLYESYIHPLTILSTLPSAGVGALLILMVSGYDLSVIALIGIILLIGIVKKNAIMMIDFALAGGAHRPVERGSDLPGLHPALPPDHDDDDGGAARRAAADARHRHRLGAAPAARLRHRRRAAAEPGADALHDAGRLSLSRPPEQAPRPAQRHGGTCARTRSACSIPNRSPKLRPGSHARMLMPPVDGAGPAATGPPRGSSSLLGAAAAVAASSFCDALLHHEPECGAPR